MPSILLVDDDAAIRRTFRVLLEGEGYAVRVARNADDALAKLSEARPDLVLLDVMMPGRNGFAVCEEIRRTDKLLPVLFLTAMDAEADQVRGFGLGADDYIPKTTGDAELLARIRRALDRAAAYSSARSDSRTVRLGAATVDFDRHVVSDGGKATSLTTSESELLRCLASRRGEMFSANDIFSFLRGEGYVGDPATIRMHVMNLRRKLGRAGDMVVTVPNSGYYLVK